ncbi:MAG TPA: peptidyl-prolyl cis-trans isomerase [Dongiaceae bacterium]|nr:peptidyl-prolyl cis-trans isomerase [Dongiaceae bacterium]
MTALLAGVLTLLALTVHAELANGVKAIVGDKVITYQEVEQAAKHSLVLLQQRYASQPDVYQKKAMDVLSDALEGLVRRQLVLQEFKASGFTLPENLLDQAVQDRIRQQFGDRVTLTKSLQEEHTTFEAWRQQIKEQYIYEAMMHKYVNSAVIMSPYKIEAYYKAHQDDFKVEDQIHLRMIVLDSTAADTLEARQKLGTELLGKLKEGAKFDELASIYSTGSQRKQGGDWGWVERSVLRKELADVAFALKAGEYSDVITVGEVCYVMQVVETRPAHVKPLADVRDDIENTLLGQESQRVGEEWIASLKKKIFVRYF